MNCREGVKISRRYQLRFSEPLCSELEAFARARDLSACAAIRFLLRQGLDRDSERPDAFDSPAAVAGLIASEQTLLVVASILPGGRSLVAELAAEASTAAERRIALIERTPANDARP